MSIPKERAFAVQIRQHFPMTNDQALDKLMSWLETYGHTSVGHGFDFISVDKIELGKKKA